MLYVVVAGGDFVGAADTTDEARRITEAARKDDDTVDITVHRLESVVEVCIKATRDKRGEGNGPVPPGEMP